MGDEVVCKNWNMTLGVRLLASYFDIFDHVNYIRLRVSTYVINVSTSTLEENTFPHLGFAYFEHDLDADK